MAINFPPNGSNPNPPADGEEYTDPNSGTWVYDSGTNSWTLVAGGSASAFNFIGGHDFRGATEPNGSGAGNAKEAGDVWIHDAPNGAINAVYGMSGSIARGQLVMWDGNSYVQISGTLPGYPSVDDGEGATLDARYLKLGAGAGAQTVQSTDTTKFEGLIDANGGVRVGNRATSTVVTGLGVISDVLRINKDSRVRIGISDARTTVSDPLRVETELDTQTSTTTFNCTSRCVLTAGEHEIVHFSSTNTGFDTYATDVKTFVASFNGVKPSGDESNPNYGYGFYSQINNNSVNDGKGEQLFSFFAEGNSPNFFKGSTYIGGTYTRNTRKLWESTLTEEQKEQLAAGTLTIPANVSNPGDGSFVRQWWYDQQSAEDQALIDSGELEYPERYKAENFVDTFALGDNTTINLLSNGRGEFGGGIKISGSSSNTAIENGFVYDSTNNKLVTIESGSKVAAISEGKFVFGGQTPYDGTLIALRGNLPVNQSAAGSRTSTFIRCEASFPVANDTVTGILVRTGPEADGYTGTFTGFKSFADNTNSPNTRWATCTEFKAFESAEAFGYAQNNYAFYSNLGTSGANVNYNFYAAGAASNWFAGPVTGGGADGANAKWSIAANGTATGITVTRASVVTDEQAGTVETLLDIITDLRARVAALEAGNGGY